MASMEDLIAAINGDLHAGKQGDDLRDLHAKLSQTLNNPIPHSHYRPIPPPSTATGPSGPLPPPAPASSWNTPPPNSFLFSSSPHASRSAQKGFNTNNASSSSSSGPASKRESGFSVPMPNTIQEQDERGQTYGGEQQRREDEQQRSAYQRQQREELEERPYHASVLPIRASPKETGGFTDDAFKPLWNERDREQWGGFRQNGR
ncbi:hypothetical protein IAU60_003351 [Kwoniella sp. DSM 27419]